jgi:hypothetical protein
VELLLVVAMPPLGVEDLPAPGFLQDLKPVIGSVMKNPVRALINPRGIQNRHELRRVHGRVSPREGRDRMQNAGTSIGGVESLPSRNPTRIILDADPGRSGVEDAEVDANDQRHIPHGVGCHASKFESLFTQPRVRGAWSVTDNG